MNLEMARTIAAFSGLGLGVINSGILIYKEFIRKAELTVKIKRAEIRSLSPEFFDIQIDIELSSKGGDVYLKNISLENNIAVFNPVQNINKRTLYSSIDTPGYNLLDLNPDTFKDKCGSLFKNSIKVINTKLQDNEHKLITIADRIRIERHMDGFWEWPINEWHLAIGSSAEEIKIPFNFTIHQSSQGSNFTR